MNSSRDPLSKLVRMVSKDDAEYMRLRRRLPPRGALSRRAFEREFENLLEEFYNFLLGID